MFRSVALRFRLTGEARGLSRILHNTAWLYAEKAVRICIGLILIGWTARYLGPEFFGLFNYALALVALGSGIAKLGLEKMLVRELVRAPSDHCTLLGDAFFLRLFGGCVTAFGMYGVAELLRPADGLLHALVAILSLGAVLQSFDVITAYFESEVRSKYTAMARAAAFVTAAAIKIALIIHGAPLVSFGWATVAEIAMVSLGLIFAYRVRGRSLMAWRWRSEKALQLLHDAWPFALASLATVVYARIDQVMIGHMLDDTAVGSYSAAVRLIEFWQFIPAAILSSVFPAIVRAKSLAGSLYESRLTRLYELMVLLGVSLAGVTTFFASNIVQLIYGAEYSAASNVLSIYAWAGIAIFLGGASSQYLVTENLARISLYRTLIGAAANIGLNAVLIPSHGLEGAAIASVVSYFIATFALVLFRPTALHAYVLLRAFLPLELAITPLRSWMKANKA